jgi:RNA polymerase sigma factor (sigma-70 family)
MEEMLRADLAGARAGERQATEAIVRRVGRIALPLAASVLGDRELAGDVAQDVAVDALRGLARLRELERFDAWVRRIAVRHTLRAANARRRRWHAEVPLAALADEALAPEAPEPTEALILRDALQRALPMLSPRQRLALALRYVHGLSDAEIAAALGCRPGTAASLLSRARATLLKHGALADVATNPVSGGL